MMVGQYRQAGKWETCDAVLSKNFRQYYYSVITSSFAVADQWNDRIPGS